MTEQQLRKKYVDYAITYLGCKESDGSFKKIIDLYNSHKPLAQGYKMKYTDAWCACYVSAMAIGCGLTDIIPLEVSCGRYITLAKQKGIWVESDSYTPKQGDLILYDWDDTGSGDAASGADHIGIVVSVSGKSIKVIEGNNGDAVAYRTIQVNGRYIRGFVTPKYASKATSGGSQPPATPTTEHKVGGRGAVRRRQALCVRQRRQRYHRKGGPSENHGYLFRGQASPTTSSTRTAPAPCTAGWIPAPSRGGPAAQRSGCTPSRRGDSLWAIAQRELGNGNRWQEISKLNGLTSTTIRVGQKLKLPV